MNWVQVVEVPVHIYAKYHRYSCYSVEDGSFLNYWFGIGLLESKIRRKLKPGKVMEQLYVKFDGFSSYRARDQCFFM